MTHGADVKRENAVMTRNVYNSGKCVFNDMLKVQRKQNLQLYLFETVKYTINWSVILLTKRWNRLLSNTYSIRVIT